MRQKETTATSNVALLFRDVVEFTGEVSGPWGHANPMVSITSAACSGGSCYQVARYAAVVKKDEISPKEFSEGGDAPVHTKAVRSVPERN